MLSRTIFNDEDEEGIHVFFCMLYISFLLIIISVVMNLFVVFIVEPQEVHTDENRALPEKKQKRIVKTPAQVAALENFYNGMLISL